ncbi:uncharacterized protein LOC134543075 isoform X3 [Bacillus rossius redtenbacheri]|uniref:uncharacterized protein LOC134543075 isoform X3 n=1 Tax=Bacillus rossius redtenbacheri TaxID=93214 RepID=UPI002FDD49CF
MSYQAGQRTMVVRMILLWQCAVLWITGEANCPERPGHQYCVQLSPRAQQREAVAHCYQLWDRANVTVWQLHRLRPDVFHELRLELMSLGVREVWLEAEAPHDGGLFLHTYPGNALLQAPVAGLELAPARGAGKRCVSWQLPAMRHTPRRCRPSSPRRYFPAVCLASPSPVRVVHAGCPPGFFRAPRIARWCVSVQRTDDLVNWGQAADICKAAHWHAHVIQLGYGALVRGGFGTCPVGLRKVETRFGEVRYVWIHKNQYLDEVVGVSLKKLLSANTTQSVSLGAVKTGSNPSLFLVPDNFKFNCVACEMPVTSVAPTLTLMLSNDTVDSDWLCLLANLLTVEATSLKLKRVYRNGTLFLLHVHQQNYLKVTSPNAVIHGVKYSIAYIRNVDYCAREEVQQNDVFLDWPKTEIGKTVKQVKHGKQYSRTCKGDFTVGAHWSIQIEANDETQSNRPENISDYLAISGDSRIVEEVHPEILEAASSLQKLAGTRVNKTMLLSAIDIFDNVLNFNISSTVNSRAAGTDILQNMDNILKNVQVNEDLKIVKQNTAVFISGESGQDQIAGISFSTPQQVPTEKLSRVGNSQLDLLHHNQSVSFLLKKSNVDVAVLFSESVSKLKPRMCVIFGNSSVLVSASKWDAQNTELNSKVVGVVVKGKDGIFEDGFVDVMFRPQNVVGKKMCAYWDFITWSWNTRGCKINSSVGGLDVCRCRHATYFAEMVIRSGRELSSSDHLALDVISIGGCTLSLAGLLGIGVTAAAIPGWRRKPSNQLLLNLSAAVGLKMLLFLVAATGRTGHGAWCVAVGAGLHYALLASFCWMLLVALLQYQRLVNVFGRPHPSRLLLKSSLFSWGVPSVPVAALLLVDPRLYTTRADFGPRRKFCYPGGTAFYLAVVFPVSVVTSCNVLIFFAIILNISNCVNRIETKAYGLSSRKAYLYRVLMGLLLFFLLGTTWVFGLLAQVTVFAYIFCITATLQGAVLFLFFIAGSQKTRARWSVKMPTYSIKRTVKSSSATRTTSTSRTQQSDVPEALETYTQKQDIN